MKQWNSTHSVPQVKFIQKETEDLNTLSTSVKFVHEVTKAFDTPNTSCPIRRPALGNLVVQHSGLECSSQTEVLNSYFVLSMLIIQQRML